MNELIDIKFYSQIKSILESARGQVYKTTNAAMVMAYWQIGKNIVEQQGGDERADYGARLISELSKADGRFRQGIRRAESSQYARLLSRFPELEHSVYRIDVVALPHRFARGKRRGAQLVYS